MRLPDGWDVWGLVKDDDGREAPDPTDTYYLTAYLTSGLAFHEPACVQVWAQDGRMLVAALEQRLHPYHVGHQTALVSRNYLTPVGRPTVDPQAKGGYIDQFIEGLEAGGYRGSIAREQWLSKPHETQRAGFGEQRPTVDNILAAIQRAIEKQDCSILSASLLRALMLASVDETGELQEGPGRRVGPVLCAGRALHVLNLRGPSRRDKAKLMANPVLRLREKARARARTGSGPREDWGE